MKLQAAPQPAMASSSAVPARERMFPPPARTLLALMGLDQLGADPLAATRGIPYDFVDFIHEMVLLCVERS